MSEEIARKIEEQIRHGELRPGQVLPSESRLMKELGAARNTVREALRLLQASGLIEIKRGSRGGPTVTHTSSEFVSDFLIKALSLRGVTGPAFYAFRLAIEPSVAEAAATAEHIDPAITSGLEENIMEARSLFLSGKPTIFSNIDFHVLLADATQNMFFTVLARTLKAGLSYLAPAKEPFCVETIGFHERILRAIKDHDPSNARNLMYKHLTEIGQIVKPEDSLVHYL